MKTKSLMTMLLMAAMACGWTACSDKEDNEPTPDNDRSDSDYIMTPAQIADYATDNFITHVCKVEFDSTTAKPISWDVNYGRVLYPETPKVRYARAETLEDTREKFLSMICMEATIDSSSVIGAMTVAMGSHGSVKYTPIDHNGEWARIDVNLKELPDLQAIVYSKPEAWPENADDIGVHRGNVFVKNEGGHDVYYICVKDCSDYPGYLIGFDTWTISSKDVEHKYRGKNCYHAWWWNLPGNSEVIRYLRSYLYKDAGAPRAEAVDRIQKISDMQGGHWANEANCGDKPLYNFLYSTGKLAGRTPFFQTGDDHAYIDTHNPIFVSGQWHWIRIPYTMMEPTHISCSKIAYECDEIDPTTHNGNNTHTCNVEQGSNWGVAWCCFRFGAEWIWKVNEWYSFQRPYVIVFGESDGPRLQDFLDHHKLRKVNFSE